MNSSPTFEILSAKEWKGGYTIQTVYEWDDIIASKLGIPLDTESQVAMNKIYEKPVYHFLQKFIRNSFLKNYIDISFNYLLRKKKNICFISHQLYVIDMPSHYIYQPNSIPIFIDCFKTMAEKIVSYCKKNPLLFVTDYEVYQELQQTRIAHKTKYIPLSISDIHIKKTVPEKKIDVLQMGRQNPVLHEWMIRFTKKFPEIEYVYANRKDEIHAYYSTTQGWIHETVDTRDEFMQFLGSAKISLLSSPGIDGGDKARTGGYNPVTPRFYESAINYCYLVGRYPDSPDFIHNDVSSVCERPENYEDFETVILKMLAEPFSLQKKYQPFIEKHLTSVVAESIRSELKKL